MTRIETDARLISCGVKISEKPQKILVSTSPALRQLRKLANDARSQLLQLDKKRVNQLTQNAFCTIQSAAPPARRPCRCCIALMRLLQMLSLDPSTS